MNRFFLPLYLLLALGLPCLVQAQMGFNSPAGVSPTQDLELYTRNGLLVQRKYKVAPGDPNANVNTMINGTNPNQLKAPAGILKDPSGDANYSGGVVYSASQTIFVSGAIGIEIVFEDLDTEAGLDYVLLENVTGDEQQRLSGSTIPPRIAITGSFVTVQFVTNSNAVVGRGFRLRWRGLLDDGTSAPTPIAFGTSLWFNAAKASFQTGFRNNVSGQYATAIGIDNSASGKATIALGSNNTASGKEAVALGSNNTASGDNATAIGFANTASEERSTALGSEMNTNFQDGAFLIGDADPLNQGSTLGNAENRFVARFLNGYYLMTSGDDNPGSGFGAVRTGVQITRGQSSWASISDSTKKERFRPINHAEVLQKINAMRLTTWNYKGQHSIRHWGPMAQDFYAAFGQDGLGQVGCDTLIYSHDFAGVTFAGVQALIRENQMLKADMADLCSRMALLEKVWLRGQSRGAVARRISARTKR